VHSEIPLQPGQTLLVSQEQGAGGEIRLRLIRDGATPETAGRQAVGGQVYAWTQTDQEGHNYFYLALHTILNNYGLRNCELYIYPPAGQQNGGNEQDA
jgi:hypothetical protein